MSYLDAAKDFYRGAAITPDEGLCCTTSPIWALPELVVPPRMLEMNYGCGSTVHPRDLTASPTVVYVGVGGGLELLQFAYFCRRPRAVIGIEPVAEMREAARANLAAAAKVNSWFREEYVDLREGDALSLPLPDSAADVTAQNCLFNIFRSGELRRALDEIHRVLRPHGRFVSSDPVAPCELPVHLQNDDRLRAMCLSGSITYERYIQTLVDVGFGTVEVRARRPYRVLDPQRFGVERPLLLESIEVAAIKDPMPEDGACVFTGRSAIYYGADDEFDDAKGHVLRRDTPMAVCDKTAAALECRDNPDLLVTPSTWFYDGGGCC